MRDIVTSIAEVAGSVLIVAGLGLWLGTAAALIAGGLALVGGSWLYGRGGL